MRDENDKATLGDLLPTKRGRPCLDLDNGPMTDDERARRYRVRKAKRLKAGFMRPQQLSDALLVDLIAKCLADGSSKRTVARHVAELARRYPA